MNTQLLNKLLKFSKINKYNLTKNELVQDIVENYSEELKIMNIKEINNIFAMKNTLNITEQELKTFLSTE